MIDPNQHDHFVLRQRFAPVINRYEFSLADGEPPFCFVEQKRFTFKEDIRFYTDESKSTELLRIKARQRFDPRATYDVTGADGHKIGEIRKVFGTSLLRSTYAINSNDGTVTAQEQNPVVALFRRLVQFIPYVGDFADWLPIAYDFEFRRGEQVLGHNRRRRWQWRDVYDLDFTLDPQKTIDRRLVLAAAVGMDALQAR